MPDKSLPALNIQHQFFQILERMTIDTISLKMSGLGKVVVFYSMCNRVEPSIKRSAEHLIGKRYLTTTRGDKDEAFVLTFLGIFDVGGGIDRGMVTTGVEAFVVVPRSSRCVCRVEPGRAGAHVG